MSVMDSLGYLGVFAVFLVAEFAPAFNDYLITYNILGQVFGWMMLGLYVFAAVYFSIKLRSALSGIQDSVYDINDPLKTRKTERTEELKSFTKTQSDRNDNSNEDVELEKLERHLYGNVTRSVK